MPRSLAELQRLGNMLNPHGESSKDISYWGGNPKQPTDWPIKKEIKEAYKGSVPVAIRTYLETVLGKDAPITEEDLTDEELYALYKSVKAREDKKYLGYQDYQTDEFTYPSSSLVGNLGKMWKDPQASLMYTLGAANVSEKDNGEGYEVEDMYDFAATPERMRELSLKDVISTAHKAAGERNPRALLNFLGNAVAPKGQGRPVNISVPASMEDPTPSRSPLEQIQNPYADHWDQGKGPSHQLPPEDSFNRGLESIIDNFTPVGVGAIRGMKPGRLIDLYHGTRTDQSRKSILREGFTKGQSDELHIPGTSISRDPLISSETFADRNINNVLKVELDLEHSQIRNLRPSEYATGVIPEEAIYGKPQSTFNESEIFARRPLSSHPIPEKEIRRMRGQAREITKKMSKAQDDIYAIKGASTEDIERNVSLRKYITHLKEKKGKIEDALMRTDTPGGGQQVLSTPSARLDSSLTVGKEATILKEGLPKVKGRPLTTKERLRLKRQQKVYNSALVKAELARDQVDTLLEAAAGEQLYINSSIDWSIAADSLNPANMSPAAKYSQKKFFSEYFRAVNRMKGHHAMYQRAILSSGSDFSIGHSLLDLFDNPDYIGAIWKPLGVNTIKLEEHAYKTNRLLKSYTSQYFNRNTLTHSPEARQKIDDTYREYKKSLNEFMNTLNKEFGVL